MAYSKKEIESKFIEIINLISNGDSLRTSLVKCNVSQTSFYKWVEESESKNIQYARAREDRADKIFEDILDIADYGQKDLKTLPDGSEVVDQEIVQRSKIKIDARKWMLGKMQPKKYGDKGIFGDDKPTEINISFKE